MSHSKIKFSKDTVTKKSEPELMRIEVEKTRRAHKIGNSSGLFYVPKVLEYNKDKGIAVFERIHGLKPIKDVLTKAGQYKNFVKQLGKSLAVIHQELYLPDDMVIHLPTDISLPGTEVFLHGDFNADNICVTSDNLSSLVILDWQMTSRHGGRATYGSRFFDLVWFINYLIWKPTFNYLIHDPIPDVTKFFLQSYFKEVDFAYDEEKLVRYSKNFFATKLKERKQRISWKRQCFMPYNKFLEKKFINSLALVETKEIF